MKEIINKKMKEVSVLLIAVLMVLSTVGVTADTNNESPTFMLADVNYISHSQQINTLDSDWIHFDDGTNANAIGLVQGGRFEFAARFTPDELVDWAGYQISVVRHHHGFVTGSPFWMKGSIKIYEEGTSTTPGSLITSEPFEVTDIGWFDVELLEPVLIAGDEDIWVSIEASHVGGKFPAGIDCGPAVDGKGDWLYLEGSGWQEMQDVTPYDCNFNIWAEVETPSEPPEKPQRPYGPAEGVIGVEYTFCTSTTDPEGDQVYFLWDWGDDTPTDWLGPFDSGATACANHAWTEAGMYEITVQAKDIIDKKSEWSDPKTIYIADMPILEIGNITGGLFKVSTVIRNIGGVDAIKVNWSIILNGGLILLGKETTGSILSLPAGGETKISSSLIFGFGKTVVTVTAEISESSDAKEQDVFVFLFVIF